MRRGAMTRRNAAGSDVEAFLLDLGLHAPKLRDVLLDSTGAMAAAKLAPTHRALLRRGVPRDISRAVVLTRAARSGRRRPRRAGELIVVGTGIDIFTQLTPEARAWIEAADEVLYVVGDAAAARFIRTLNPRAESLITLYAQDKRRDKTYEQMVQRMLAGVRGGSLVCAALYGHPGVLTYASHEAIRRARREGFSARMLPGISTDACLFADVGLDPSRGYQSFEATHFVVHRRRRFDPTSALVLWQVDSLGDPTFQESGFTARHLPVLRDILIEHYGARHEVVLYRAPVFPTAAPEIRRVRLGRLTRRDVQSVTMYVPAKERPAPDTDMLKRLGLSLHQWRPRGPTRIAD